MLSGCGLLLVSVPAMATLIETQTVPPTATMWTETLDFAQYNPADNDGKALLQVNVLLEMEVTGEVTFTGSNTTINTGNAGGSLAVTGPGGIDVSVEAVKQIAPPAIQLVSGQPVVIGIDTSDSVLYQFTGAAILAASTGTGTVPYDLVADGLLTLKITGGNISVNQNTTVGASVTVEYIPIPEPASLALMLVGGLGLLIGCGGGRRP
ncbi:MAG: hypothetical protein A2W31_14230 [Planctomycetes bacterium RBG_16_64_10]|nr:MAG: hypothetical protein A2W31_14230 [Planctomycetes bacterium RBG_16_64_10]